jgi:hypothetical protein
LPLWESALVRAATAIETRAVELGNDVRSVTVALAIRRNAARRVGLTVRLHLWSVRSALLPSPRDTASREQDTDSMGGKGRGGPEWDDYRVQLTDWERERCLAVL